MGAFGAGCVAFSGGAAAQPRGEVIARAAEAMVGADIQYNPAYVGMEYPGGDVPANTGVCADVLVRAFRADGTDLQRLIHEDMARAFDVYPARWGLTRPDRNIDHRRVLNIERFLERQGAKLQASRQPSDYLPGDVVAWTLPGGLPHIGIVSTQRMRGGNPLIVHHIGGVPRLEDVLFSWPMTGHYRYPLAP